MAEGKNIEADIITQASYYLESAQKEHDMFAAKPSSIQQQEIKQYPDYMTPVSYTHLTLPTTPYV